MLRRHITETITVALRDTPVVLLVGPRQAGKSTLARTLVPPDRYVTVDEATTLAAARRDPADFLAPFDELTVIDEVQRAPDLLLAVKVAVDRRRRAASCSRGRPTCSSCPGSRSPSPGAWSF